MRVAERKPSYLWNHYWNASSRKAYSTVNRSMEERQTPKISFPKPRSCERVIRFQPTKNLRGLCFLTSQLKEPETLNYLNCLSVLKKNPQYDSNQGINHLKVSNLMLQSLRCAIWQHLWHIWSFNSVQVDTELRVLLFSQNNVVTKFCFLLI